MSDAGIIYKTHNALDRDAGSDSNGSLTGYDDPLPFSDEQIDIVARTMALLREELQTEIQRQADALAAIRERVATIEGQLSVLMTLLGSNNNNNNAKTIEASETNMIRKLHVSTR
jgi:hypothetical protein